MKSIICILFLTFICFGTIIAVNNLENATLSAAYTSANSGDTIYCQNPDTVTWTSTLTINELTPYKKIAIIGLDASNCLIIHDIASNNPTIKAYCSADNFVQISNITFQGNAVNSATTNGCVNFQNLSGQTYQNSFRLDHCRFTDITDRGGLAVGCFGTVDHCYFQDRDAVTEYSAHGFDVFGYDIGNESWSMPDAIGSDSAVFIENCYFDFNSDEDGLTDAYRGGRYVWRYNIGKNGGNFGNHGYDSDCDVCTGGFSFEIYNNKFESTQTGILPLILRGGTATVFNNMFRGTYNNNVLYVTHYRSTVCPEGCLVEGECTCCADCNTVLSAYQKGRCDGSGGSAGLDGDSVYFSSKHTGLDNSGGLKLLGYNLNDSLYYGWYVRNITDGSKGRILYCYGDSIYAVLSGGTDNDFDYNDNITISNGYPCYHQPGRGSNNSSSPVYVWGNKNNGNDMSCVLNPNSTYTGTHPAAADHIKEGRDYFNNVNRPNYKPYRYPIYGKQNWTVRKP